MTRMLLTLMAIQVLAIGWLVMDVRDLQQEIQQLQAARQSPPVLPLAKDAGRDLPDPVTDSGDSAPDLAAIRAIVREELQSALAGLPLETLDDAPSTRREMTEEESLEQLQATMNAIDTYMQSGRLDPQSMGALRQQIAKLNPDHQTQALSYLAGAMNSGQLDARM